MEGESGSKLGLEGGRFSRVGWGGKGGGDGAEGERNQTTKRSQRVE